MSMPSDVTSDIGDTMSKRSPRERSRRATNLLREITPEQIGLAAATLVAFLGVALVGPRVAELRRPPTLRERARVKARDTRRRAEAASARATARLRRVGLETFKR